jgi:hypothetical protein
MEHGDTMQTTLMKIDYGPKLGEAFPETREGYTIDDAVSDILAGAPLGLVRGVYSIHDGLCEDVSEIVADRIIAAWNAGQFVSSDAREFVDWCGRQMERAA